MSKFNIGDKVKVIQGKFKDNIGIIQSLNESYYPGQINPKYDVHLEDGTHINDIPLNEDMLEKVELNSFEQSLLETQMIHSITCDIADNEAFFEMAGRIPGEVKIPGKPKDPGLIIAVGARENRGEAHFHIYRCKKDLEAWKNGACLLFKENRYFDHALNKETLTEDELNAVIECLKSKPKEGLLGNNNWEYLISLWNSNNYNFRIDLNTPMPNYDYKTITRYKVKK